MRRLLLLVMCISTWVTLFAQNKTVSGTVTDAAGAPVMGASVQVKGSRTGTTTNQQGAFSLSVPQGARSIIVSYVGLDTKEIDITNNATSYQVNLSSSAKTNMQEVVVVAYGTQTKRKVTGSVVNVGGSELENKPFTSFQQMLQGRVPGLQSISQTGQPGALPQVRIRGIGSITAGASPIYVVDGVIVNSSDFSRINTSSDPLAGINPNDIESVSILKDAASTAIYGSQGSNGVILVTTKKGRTGKSKVRVDADYGQSRLGFLNDLSKPLTRDEYFALTKEGLVNGGYTQAQMDNILNGLGYNNTANEDWIANVTRTGIVKTINTSVSGGDPKTTFYASAGYTENQAVVITSDFKRYSGTFNVKHKASDKFAFGLNATGSYVDQNGPSQSSNFRNPVFDAYSLRPSQPAYNPDGSVNYSTATFNQLFNPLAIAQYDKTHLNNVHIISNINGEYQFYKDLSFSSAFGIDHFNIEEEQYYNPFFGDARTVGGRIYNYDTRVSRWTFTNLLNYRHKFLANGDLDLDLKVGYEANKSKEYRITARGESLPATTLIPLPTPSTNTASSGFRSDFSYASALSLLQLNYQSKYSLSGSFRRDGSSRFGTNNKYGNFWSVGIAWNLDQEKFMNDITFINALKLRSSYGRVGNGQFTNYGWRGTYSFGSTYNGQPGSAPNIVGNPDLSWEVSKPFNVGVDASLWNNRINFTIEYYNKKTTELLYAIPLALSAGVPPPTGQVVGTVNANVGGLENKGWEFQLNVTPVKTKDFSWDVNFNISLNKNRILSLPSNNIIDGNKIRRIGEDFQSIRTRLWAGVDPATGAPLWYTDSTRKATTTNFSNATPAIIGSASPKGFGGFGTSLDYKGFNLSAQFAYQYGNLVYDNWGFVTWSDGFNPQFNRIRKQLGRWQKPGDITDIPKYVYGGANTSNAESSRWYYKGDFVRLRDITLSYTLPKSILSRIKVENVKFYIRGTNLWTKAFDKNITFDPEQPIDGTSDLQIMIPKTVSVGLTLGF